MLYVFIFLDLFSIMIMFCLCCCCIILKVGVVFCVGVFVVVFMDNKIGKVKIKRLLYCIFGFFKNYLFLFIFVMIFFINFKLRKIKLEIYNVYVFLMNYF